MMILINKKEKKDGFHYYITVMRELGQKMLNCHDYLMQKKHSL